MNHYIKLTVVAFVICLITQQHTIAQGAEPSKGVSGGVAVNLFSLFGNYNTFMLSGNVVFNEQFGIEVGGGPVIESEVWVTNMRENENTIAPPLLMFFDILGASSDNRVDQHQGYSLFGEFKYYVVPGRHQPFFGMGYSYLNSKYSANYVVRMNQGSNAYYRNVEQEYQSIVNTYYLMIGYRMTFAQEKLFLEVGVNFRRVYKEVSPEFLYNDKIVTNEGFVKDIDKYPLPISFDLKIGVKLF